MSAPSSSFALQLADAPAAPAPAAPAAAPTVAGTQQPAPGFSPQAGCAGGSQGWQGIVPFVLIFAVFYFMLIRPQQKKQKDQQDWLKNLKKDDEIVTTGGLIGRITGLTDTIATVEVQEKVRVRVLRSQIAGQAPSASGKGSQSSSASAAK